MTEMTALEKKRKEKIETDEIAQEALDALIPKPVGYRLLIALPNVEESFSGGILKACLLYTSPSPRDRQKSRMPSSA